VVPALLIASLSDTNEEVLQKAQRGLDRMRLSHEKALHLCSGQLGDSSYAEAALRKGGAPAVPILIEALRTEDPAIRVKAARALGCLGEVAAEAAAALTAALQDDDLEVRLAAVKSLWNITKTADDVVPTLVDLLEGPGGSDLGDGEARRRFLQTVMEALNRIGPAATAAGPALSALTKDRNRHIRESALLTLQKMAPPVATKAGLRR